MKNYKTPAINEPSQRAIDFFNKISSSELLGCLYWRWMDESQYEDINDYKKPIDPIAEEFGVTIVRMNRRPFGFNFSVDGRTFKLSMNSRQVSYMRLS